MLWHAVDQAERAVDQVHSENVPEGDLSTLAQQLHRAACQVDDTLLGEAGTRVHNQCFEEAALQAAKVISASTRIEFTATTLVADSCGEREKMLAAAFDKEAAAILGELAAWAGSR